MPAAVATRREAESVQAAAAVLPIRPIGDPMFERVAAALRGARARTGLSEAQAVEILQRQGVPITLLLLRRAERTGSLDLVLASHLADVYGMTTDCLAGRRCNRPQIDHRAA